MYILISIFYVSILAMVAMVLLKRREIATGQESVVSRAGGGSDHIFQAVFIAVKHGISLINRKSFAMLAHWLAVQALRGVRHVYVEVKSQTLANPHGKKIIDAVRGRGEIKASGASFYLRRISADHPAK